MTKETELKKIIGVMNIEMIGDVTADAIKYSGIERGILKMPDSSMPPLIAVGENEIYLHCFTQTGDYWGVFKSDDENHLYQHLLRLNTRKPEQS